MEASLLRSLHTDKGSNGGNYDARIRGLDCRKVCLKREKAETLHYNAGYESEDMFIHTILSVNHTSFYRAQLRSSTSKKWKEMPFSKNRSQHFTRHETSDLWSHSLRDQSHSIQEDSSIEFKSRSLVSRDAGFSKSVEVGQFAVVRPQLYLKDKEPPRLGVTIHMMRDDPKAEAKSVFGR